MVRVDQALPLWGRRPKAGGGSFGIVGPGYGRPPIAPSAVAPDQVRDDAAPRGGGTPE